MGSAVMATDDESVVADGDRPISVVRSRILHTDTDTDTELGPAPTRACRKGTAPRGPGFRRALGFHHDPER